MPEPVIPTSPPDFDTNLTHVAAPTSPQLIDGFVLDEVPTSALFNYMLSTAGLWINWLSTKLSRFPGYKPDPTLTIATGVVTATTGNHAIETEGAAASDDLTNILTTNMDISRMLVVGCFNAAHVVVVKHAAGGAGQIHTADGLDFSLNSLGAILTLKRIGADWYEVSRSVQVSATLPGVLQPYGGTAAPAGYLLCDGAAVSRATYASLFSVLSTRFGGGDGSTTFNVPNLKGRFLRGLASYADTTCTALPSGTTGTFTGHPYKQTGERVRLTGGSVAGLAAATDYWVIVVDANTLSFATTLANAIAGTAISLSSNSAAVISQWEDPDLATRVASTVGASAGNNLGSLQVDGFKSHTHTQDRGAGAQVVQSGSGANDLLNSHDFPQTAATGGTETRPLNVAVNYIIKF